MSTETPTAPSSPDQGDTPNEGVFLNPNTQVLDRTEKKQKRWIKPTAVGATLLAAGGLTWAALRGGEDNKAHATPPVAAGSRTPGASPEASVSATATATPSATESEPLTASREAESLTATPEQYDPELMKKFEATASDIDRIKTHFADKYPSITDKFDTVLTRHDEAFSQLTSDVLVDAQSRYNNALAHTIYTDESVKAGHPTLARVGEYFSSGDYSNASFTLPNGIMPPSLITEYAQKAKSNHLPADQSIQSFLAQQLDSDAVDWSMLGYVGRNEKQTTNFFQKMPADEAQKYVAPTSSSLDFLQAHYIYKPGADMQSFINKASDGNNTYATCGESFLIKASHEDVTYGPTSIPVNGLTFACEEPGQFLVESFVLLPVDSYYQGKKTNKQVLQPFILQADAFPAIK